MNRVLHTAVLAGSLVIVAVPTSAQQGVSPYVGKWKCDTGVFTFTATEMLAPHTRAKIEKSTKRNANTYVLKMNGADERLVFKAADRFEWHDGTDDKPVRCRRM